MLKNNNKRPFHAGVFLFCVPDSVYYKHDSTIFRFQRCGVVVVAGRAWFDTHCARVSEI